MHEIALLAVWCLFADTIYLEMWQTHTKVSGSGVANNLHDLADPDPIYACAHTYLGNPRYIHTWLPAWTIAYTQNFHFITSDYFASHFTHAYMHTWSDLTWPDATTYVKVINYFDPRPHALVDLEQWILATGPKLVCRWREGNIEENRLNTLQKSAKHISTHIYTYIYIFQVFFRFMFGVAVSKVERVSLGSLDLQRHQKLDPCPRCNWSRRLGKDWTRRIEEGHWSACW